MLRISFFKDSVVLSSVNTISFPNYKLFNILEVVFNFETICSLLLTSWILTSELLLEHRYFQICTSDFNLNKNKKLKHFCETSHSI